MNGGLNDRATALNTDGKCCRRRELEEGEEGQPEWMIDIREI